MSRKFRPLHKVKAFAPVTAERPSVSLPLDMFERFDVKAAEMGLSNKRALELALGVSGPLGREQGRRRNLRWRA